MDTNEYRKLQLSDVSDLNVPLAVVAELQGLLELAETLDWDVLYRQVGSKCGYYFRLGLDASEGEPAGSLSAGAPMDLVYLRASIEALTLISIDRRRRQSGHDQRLAALERRMDELEKAQTATADGKLTELMRRAKKIGGDVVPDNGGYAYTRPFVQTGSAKKGEALLFNANNAFDLKRRHRCRQWFFERHELDELEKTLAHDEQIYYAAFPVRLTAELPE